jgi:hypothetical protein
MSIFRDTFTPEVSGSLAARQNAMAVRGSTAIQYLNSRNSWIRMTSAVNVEGNNDLARQYVLLGGTLLNNDKLRAGVGDRTKAYSATTPSGRTNRLGIRPMPGITSIDIKSKTAYGSLREITVNFQCWDITQLEDLELLYMRPGYTVLIEWGWSPYLKNDGTIERSVPQFYDILDKKETDRSQIFRELFDKSKKSGGNYDAMYGYIKNYQWSAREDGGYDCQTTVISTGEIIESLKVNYIRADLANYGFYTAGSKGNGFLNELFDPQGNKDSYTMGQYYEKNTLAGVWAELHFKLQQSPTVKLTDVGATILGGKNYPISFPALRSTEENTLDDSDYQYYITLEAAFDIINKYIIAKSDSGNQEPLIKLSTKSSTYTLPEESTPSDLLCIAHPLQISVDPSVCLIKNSVWTTTVIPAVSEAATSAAAQNTEVDNIVKELIAASENRDGIAFRIEDFITAVKKITLENFSLVDGIFKNGKFLDNTNVESSWVFPQEGFLGLLREQLITKKNDLPSGYVSFGYPITRYLVTPTLQALYYLYRIQTSLPSGIKLTIKLSGDNAQYPPTTLDNILAGQPAPLPYFYNIKEKDNTTDFTEVITAGGGIDLRNYKNLDISLPSTTTTTNELILNTSDAVASLDYIKKIDKNYFYNDDYTTELGIIGNIYVNISFLYKKALDLNTESQDTKEKSEINLYNYVKSIISAIQPAIGNVNSFEIHVDPIDNIARVIDVNFTAPTAENLFELQVHNTKSVVRKYSLQSQIFPNQGAMIAIGSQAQGGQLGMQNNTMIDFNRNLIDRITPKKSTPKENDIDYNSSTSPAVANSLAGIVKALSTFNKPAPVESSNSSASSIDTSKAKNCLRDLIVYFQQLFASPGANRNIIPIKFSFEMDGIGGLVIGHLFKTNQDILPRGYKGPNLAQTITGIGHTISNNDWVTKIDALNIILNRSEKGGFSEHLAEVQQIISSALLLTSTEDSDGSNENKTSLVAYRGYEPQTVTKSENIKNKYEPALNETFPTLSKGIKLLMQAQVQLEGFTPGTVAYRTNNPGNVGTETSTKPPKIKKYSTLKEGIQAQWNRVLKGALNNTSSNYTSNMTLYDYLYKYAPPYNDQGKPSGNDPTSYTNFVINYFKTNANIDITATTTLEQINAIK